MPLPIIVDAATRPFDPMPSRDPQREAAEAQFRRTLIQVLIVQVVALAFLGFLQISY